MTIDKNKFEPLNCSDCKTTKAKRNRKKAKRLIETEKVILEVVELDLQGPFPVIANDGTNTNLKIIDCKSDWLYFKTIPNKSANTILDVFMSYNARIEKQTNKTIKRVRTDSGNEFMAQFIPYLQLSGIMKEKGIPYTHTHPGKAERSHQTILRSARAMLKESLLPIQYYYEAMKCAVYLFNRIPHGTKLISPYEAIYRRPPDLSNLRPFGVVCYAYVSVTHVFTLEGLERM